MAATPFDLPVTAAQVGTFFVGRYYQVLQQKPDFIHHFYSNASTMVRVDGTIRETASAVLQIHMLVMSLNYTGVEIKAAHSLESWNGGVLVMVSGSVHLKNFNVRRKFVQTFFLAPQEIGYLVLNDIFHFTDDEDQVLQLPVTYLTPTIHDSKLNASTDFQDQVPNYMLGEDFQAREFVVPGTVEDNFPAENYSFPEQRLQQVSETELFLEGNFAVQSNGSLQSTIKTVDEHPSTPMEEPIVEPQKHTYASIVAKGQSAPAVPVQSSYNKTSPPASEWSHVPEPSSHSSFSPSVTVDGLRAEPVEEVSALEDEVEVKSVYVKNVPSTASASEIKEEFKKFGKLKPNAVAIITRKDVGVCYRYAFVEFDDISGVQNAIKASTVEIAGQPVYIEGRKANRFNAFRGGRGRGRGRGSYHMDASRGCFDARDSSRSNGQDGDYSSRSGGSGYYRPKSRQGSRNGSSNQSD